MKIFNKVMEFVGLEDEEYEDSEESEQDDLENNILKEIGDKDKYYNRKQNKVVNIHTANLAKIVIIKPAEYEVATTICDNLKNRKIVVVNTNNMENKIAQRLLDFMSGASYALEGDIQEVESGIYILSPSNVEVSSDLKSELSNKGIFNWSK